MTREQIDAVIIRGLESNLEVRFAKKASDMKLTGVHIIEPTLEQLVEAVNTALIFEFSRVVIHSTIGYPCKADDKC